MTVGPWGGSVRENVRESVGPSRYGNHAMSAHAETAAEREEREYLAEIKAHRAALVQRFGENWSEKDKVVVSISSLAFGFTVGFLPRVGVSWSLIAAWLSFAVAICSVVLSYDLNASQLKRSIQRN